MSQSDYIKRIRLETQIASKNDTPINRKDNPAVLSSQFLTQIKEYDLENTIVNRLPTFNQLIPSSDLIVMEMNLRKPAEKCKTYRTCSGNNNSTLPNSVPVTMFYNFTADLPFADPTTRSPYKGTRMFSLNSGHTY